MAKQQGESFSTSLVKVTDTFAPMIERQLTGNGVNMDGYSKQCVVNAISAINTVMDSKGYKWDDPLLDRNNITQTLLNIAALKLNSAASPREVYFTLRNVPVKVRENGQDKTIWKKQVEMGIEGDGNDSILSRYGRGVKKVGQYWLVREGDEFEYPKFNGFELDPPKWSPTGKGDVIRVVYPIMRDDDTPEFHIAEREDVIRNLIAHINNNMMNETFGVCTDRRNATPDQKKKIAVKKAELLRIAKQQGLDVLDDPDLQQWISPAWTEYQSREQMIIRKMRNNITKKIPKDFGNAFVEMTYSDTADDTAAHVRKEINENANREPIDIDAKAEYEEPPTDEGGEEQPPDPEGNEPEPVEKDKEEPKPQQTESPRQQGLQF